MRNALIQSLVEVGDADERVLLLTGDLGFSVVEPFSSRFPKRFINVGVAEQNMVGIATGLAEAGFMPFVYSIATFASMRPYEFIRNGPVLHGLPVRVVGIGGGFDYGHNGVSHYALEDIAIMRTQPGMTVVAPADADQTRAAVRRLLDWDGPAYLRLGRSGKALPGLDGRFELGRAELIGDGRDVAIVAMGGAARNAIDAAGILADAGIRATVAVVSSFNPSPVDDLASLLAETPLAVTVEGHFVAGGLGSFVCEVVAENGLDTRVVRAAVRERVAGVSGDQAFMEARYGIGAAEVARAAQTALTGA